MRSLFALPFALARMNVATAVTAMEAGIVMARRMPAFAALSAQPSAAELTEVGRAVDEKVAAMWSGGWHAGLALQRLALALATGSTGPEALPGRLVAIGETAMRPARRKVRANARRFTRY